MTAGHVLHLAVAVALVITCGCSWRPVQPAPLGQILAIRVVADQGRLPRAGLDLQAAVADAVAYRTGWQVRGDGEARLDLSIDSDDFAATADDARGVPARWRYRMHLTALLVSQRGTRTWTGSGTGYAGSRAEERAAVQTAASDAADTLARWLATQQP
jgi:hypothetical protein